MNVCFYSYWKLTLKNTDSLTKYQLSDYGLQPVKGFQGTATLSNNNNKQTAINMNTKSFNKVKVLRKNLKCLT